jgi:hypothetical protein
VTDLSAEEDRFANLQMGEGKLTATAFVPASGAAATMNVVFGSGSAKADYYAVAGDDAGQGTYIVRLEGTTVTVALNAADGSLPRKDEVYLVVLDNAYDASSRALPRLAYRDGTAAASPSAPGPDSGWDAYVLLATIDVPAAAADILACTITDGRLESSFSVRDLSVAGALSVVGNITVSGTVDGVDVAAHDHDGTAAGGVALPAANLTGLKAAVDAANVDADTLDGVHAAGFVLAAHEGAGGAAHAVAVAGVSAGFISAADQTKLDGIATGATTNQTITAGTDLSGGGSGASVTINHDATGGAANINTAGAVVIDQLQFDARGHATLATTRSISPGDIGASSTSHTHSGVYYTYEGSTPSVTISTSAASGGSNGDVWLKY